jgi:hypothetical protein
MKGLCWVVAAGGGLVLAGCLQKASVAPVAPVAAMVLPAPEEQAPVPAAPPTPEGFAFGDDQGGKLLSTLLPPVDKQKVTTPLSGPRAFPPLRSLEQAELPLPPVPSGSLSLPPGQPRAPLQPRHLVEESPLTATRLKPTLPDSQPLTTGALVRTASPPIDRPVGVPYLGTGVADRASLDDPTKEASLDSALNGAVPARPGPAPFVRPSSPDPFENRDTVKIRTPPGEDGTPVTGSPRTPQ